ncbi:MAG: type II toxin-antitoxin system HicA family toxin [Oscillatoria sp. SIO1A7]|nr:type II toxin-antitoxin system HicA family toxin [Oscillatoria sp. SIO1A7]
MSQIGFDGPYNGARHQFMLYNQYRQTIPSNDEYSVPQLRMMIRQVEEIIERQISVDEWNIL